MLVFQYDCIYEPENGKDTSKYTATFNNPIILDSMDYCLGLLDIETYYSFPNIKSNNCNIRYVLSCF